jgi:hypothetical protein
MMYCKNCGSEIQEGAKFCVSCGASQGVEEAATSSVQVNFASHLIGDGQNTIKKFFSKTPLDAVAEAADSKSPIWIILVIANVVLFGVASFLNVPQMLNYLIKSVVGTVTSSFGALGNLIPTSSIPKIPALPSLFLPFALLALITLAAEFAGIYIALAVSKKKAKSAANVLNVVAVASLPITAGVIINLLLGLIFPPATICITATTVLINLVLLYEGLHNLADFQTSPIWQFGLLVLFVSIVFMVIFGIALDQVINQVMGNLINAVGSKVSGALSDGLSGALGGLFS